MELKLVQAPSQRILQLIMQLELHINKLSSRNPLTTEHDKRVGKLAARIAACMEFPEDECYKTAEAAWIHDIGKHHPEAQRWEAEWYGREAPRKLVQKFAALHSRLGKEVLPRMDCGGCYSSKEELAMACYLHHRKHSRLREPFRERIIMVQVADIYDARVNQRHYHTKHLEPSKVVRMLRINAVHDEFCSACVEALVQSKDLSLN